MADPTLARLRSQLRGSLILPDDDGYEDDGGDDGIGQDDDWVDFDDGGDYADDFDDYDDGGF